MTDENDTIELDREKLKEYAHKQYLSITGFYPEEEFAEETSQIDDPHIGSYDEQLGYANGNIVGQLDALQCFSYWFDIDMQELAREYAEENDEELFGGLPIDDD